MTLIGKVSQIQEKPQEERIIKPFPTLEFIIAMFIGYQLVVDLVIILYILNII